MSRAACAHATCSCAVEFESEYCCDGCRAASRDEARALEACSCGHRGCLGSAGREGGEALAEGASDLD